MLLVVIPVCAKDVQSALRNLRWCVEMDDATFHHALVSAEIGFDYREVVAEAQRYFPVVEEFHYPKLSARPLPWPEAQNWAWRKAALYIAKRNDGLPWLWWEQDAVPLKRGWLNALENEYLAAAKPFMGAAGAKPTPEHPDHLAGVAVYPPNVTRYAPSAMFYAKSIPFDTAGGWRVLNEAHITPLIQHVWTFEPGTSNPPTFPTTGSLSEISPDAVLFHRCKDSSLLDHLQSRPPQIVNSTITEQLKARVIKPVERLIRTLAPKPVSDVTVVITTFRRPEMLWAAYQSCKTAKVAHIAITASGVTKADKDMLKRIAKDDPKVQISSRKDDFGCNECWIRGVEMVKTGKTTILHDDDTLLPAYEKIVAGQFEADFVHWDGNKHGPAGVIPGSYVTRPDFQDGVYPATYLLAHLLQNHCYTLSPVCGCFPTEHVLQTLKECQDSFGPWAFLRPNMMVGNDLMLWLRACHNYRTVEYTHTALCSYGHWDGSTSYDDQGKGKLLPIYKAARSYFLERCPKIIHCVPRYFPRQPETLNRIMQALSTWEAAYSFGFIRPDQQWQWRRDSTAVGDNKQSPFLRDVLRHGLESVTSKNDLIAFTNDDTLTSIFWWFSAWNWCKEKEAGCSFRINMKPGGFDPWKLTQTLQGFTTPGRDAFVFTQDWLKAHLDEIPDYLLAYADWDSTLAMLMRLTTGHQPTVEEYLSESPLSEIPRGLVWHTEHQAEWTKNREAAGMKHNRALTTEFFKKRLGWAPPNLRGSW